MDITQILEQYIDNEKSVTFPVHYDDRNNLNPDFRSFGFYRINPDDPNDPRLDFSTHWNLEFSIPTRLVSVFTGVLYIENDISTHNMHILIRSFASPPLNRINSLPEWYPIPRYAKYGPFDLENVTKIVSGLFSDNENEIGSITTDDANIIALRIAENEKRVNSVVSEYRAQLESDGTEISPSDYSIDKVIIALINGQLVSGVPVSAGTILTQQGSDLTFSLHPEDENTKNYIPTLYFNPQFYFKRWRYRIGQDNYYNYPVGFRNQNLAPPLATGNVIYVSQSPVAGLPVLANLEQAHNNANENDVILILDKGIYRLNKIEKFVSVIGYLTSSDEPDIRQLDQLAIYGRNSRNRPNPFSAGPLALELRNNYPTIKNNTIGSRGLHIQYRQGRPSINGLIYLENLSVSDNRLDVTLEMNARNVGGAGILVDGRYYNSSGILGQDFSEVHIHNCAVVHNKMVNFPESRIFPQFGDNPHIEYMGGGIHCASSSPLISNCLIKANSSYFHGGGIGVFNYGWPRIISNIISNNKSMGHPSGDFDGGSNPGGNGDGGGIGVFQAYPTYRDVLENRIASLAWSLIEDSDSFKRELHLGWDHDLLQLAKRKWIHIHQNKIHDNFAKMSGGGVYGTVLSLFSMYNNQIYNNRCIRQDGGGIAVTYGSRISINGNNETKNRIVNNTAGRYGGGIYIRSSKAKVNDVLIENNRLIIETGKGGGGIAILSIPEILNVSRPDYDVIQHVIFNHIDKVKLELKDSTVQNNTANKGAGIFAFKDISGYSFPSRAVGISVGIIAKLRIHLRVSPISDIHSNTTDDYLAITKSLLTSEIVEPSFDDANNTILEMTF